jgi:hypothetical protein
MLRTPAVPQYFAKFGHRAASTPGAGLNLAGICGAFAALPCWFGKRVGERDA